MTIRPRAHDAAQRFGLCPRKHAHPRGMTERRMNVFSVATAFAQVKRPRSTRTV